MYMYVFVYCLHAVFKIEMDDMFAFSIPHSQQGRKVKKYMYVVFICNLNILRAAVHVYVDVYLC